MAATDLEPAFWSCEKSEPSSDLLNHLWHTRFSKPSDQVCSRERDSAHQDLTGVWRRSGHGVHTNSSYHLAPVGWKGDAQKAVPKSEVRVPYPASTAQQLGFFGFLRSLSFIMLSSNMKCFFSSDPSFKDSALGMECLSLLSLFFMCLECTGIYVNTFQNQNLLFSFTVVLAIAWLLHTNFCRTLQVLARFFWRKIIAIR